MLLFQINAHQRDHRPRRRGRIHPGMIERHRATDGLHVHCIWKHTLSIILTLFLYRQSQPSVPDHQWYICLRHISDTVKCIFIHV